MTRLSLRGCRRSREPLILRAHAQTLAARCACCARHRGGGVRRHAARARITRRRVNRASVGLAHPPGRPHRARRHPSVEPRDAVRRLCRCHEQRLRREQSHAHRSAARPRGLAPAVPRGLARARARRPGLARHRVGEWWRHQPRVPLRVAGRHLLDPRQRGARRLERKGLSCGHRAPAAAGTRGRGRQSQRFGVFPRRGLARAPRGGSGGSSSLYGGRRRRPSLREQLGRLDGVGDRPVRPSDRPTVALRRSPSIGAGAARLRALRGARGGERRGARRSRARRGPRAPDGRAGAARAARQRSQRSRAVSRWADAVRRDGGQQRRGGRAPRDDRDARRGPHPRRLVPYGGARLAIFDNAVTPNAHAIARRWVLYYNFYVNGEVSANGHEWTDRAFAGDYNEKTWPQIYSNRRAWDLTSGEDLANPHGVYLWDAAVAKGLWVVNFGEMTESDDDDSTRARPARTNIPGLKDITAANYPGFVLAIPDTTRARLFADSVASWDQRDRFPDLVILWLPRDHTRGRDASAPTPRAMVADNDLALGQIVERLSQSPAWPSLAVFVLEDDAQNGPDHVDAHRSVLLVASPYARRGMVDSTFYTTASVLRSIEEILGLAPLSQYDAGATPLWNGFARQPDSTSFVHLPNTWSLDERNPSAFRSRIPARDLAQADAADEVELNREIWQSVHPGSAPPPVRRSWTLRNLLPTRDRAHTQP